MFFHEYVLNIVLGLAFSLLSFISVSLYKEVLEFCNQSMFSLRKGCRYFFCSPNVSVYHSNF